LAVTPGGADGVVRPTLIIALNGDAPVPAAELGKLLTTLAADYRRVNRGRTLIVTDIQIGSVITELTDLVKNAADGAKAAKAIVDFVRTVADLFKLTKKDQATLAPGKQLRGQRSVEALLEAAINSGHEVELKHTTSDGMLIDLKVTPVEATKIRERNRLRIAQLEAAYRAALPSPQPGQPLPAPNLQLTDSSSVSTLKRDRDILRALIQSDWSGHTPNPEVEALVVRLVAALREAGMEHVLALLADELEGTGHPALGQRLRRESEG